MHKKNRPGRKLLVASLGVAAVTYVACSSGSGGGSGGGGSGGVVGNLVGPDPDSAVDGGGTGGTATDSGADKFSDFDQVANLVPPDFDASR
jgi:hypothetical protein